MRTFIREHISTPTIVGLEYFHKKLPQKLFAMPVMRAQHGEVNR